MAPENYLQTDKNFVENLFAKMDTVSNGIGVRHKACLMPDMLLAMCQLLESHLAKRPNCTPEDLEFLGLLRIVNHRHGA